MRLISVLFGGLIVLLKHGDETRKSLAYQNFAYWYDALNIDADYDRLTRKIISKLKQNGIDSGIVADLGCGTGEVVLRLAKAGYDMIGIDQSSDMLSVAREKAETTSSNILFLCQNLAELELYGTIRAAVSTFDTLNHLDRAQLKLALERVSLFIEPCGIFIFDVNTPYKHEFILANHVFELDGSDETICYWQNQYNPQERSTLISIEVIKENQLLFDEIFKEYCYSLFELTEYLYDCKFKITEILDGETFLAPGPETQRYMIVASRQ